MYVVQSAVLLLFLVAPFWNIQLKHKPFNWHHPIQCCKMKISKIFDIYQKYQKCRKYPIFSIFWKISRYFPSLIGSQPAAYYMRQRALDSTYTYSAPDGELTWHDIGLSSWMGRKIALNTTLFSVLYIRTQISSANISLQTTQCPVIS